MEKEHYSLVYQQEEDHWWYKGMRIITESLLNQYYKNNHELKILDAGCGTGINLSELSIFGKTFGVDFSDEALKFSKKRNHKRICEASIEYLPFKNSTFDLITSFEVLYHKEVQNDKRAIEQFYAVCKTNGRVLIRVPAFKILFGSHDLVVHGKRRYRKKDIQEMAIKAGFKVERITYLNFFLFLPTLIIRLVQKLSSANKKSDIKPTNSFINSILLRIFKIESFCLRRFNFPFGISLLCICRKD